MKTLDEVIHWYENRKVALIGKCTKEDMEESILHYLKEYRELAQNLRELGNDPISWGELRRMEEKPVWVENVFGLAEWELISRVKEGSILTIAADESIADIQAEDYPHRWQAYRKERE